jgi:hypothetical protein
MRIQLTIPLGWGGIEYGNTAVRQYGGVWQCGSVQQWAAVCGSGRSAVCGSARGSVRQCIQQCAAVRVVVFSSTLGSVWLSGSAAVCCTPIACGNTAACSSAALCGSTAVGGSAAVCGSAAVGGSARGCVWLSGSVRGSVRLSSSACAVCGCQVVR